MEKRTALGKGLSALIPDAPPGPPLGEAPVSEIDIEALAPNALQPRVQMDDTRLEELAASIRSHGVIQPIVVRKTDDGFRIIAGERRWRAAKRAGLTRVPVVFKDVAAEHASQNLLELALVENIQREDLNPIDEAKAYRRLVDEFHLTQDAVAAAVGKDRATVANTLRLLKLPPEVQNDVASAALSMGHARALLALPSDAVQLQAAREVKTRDLSVRETEALVKSALEGHEVGAPTPRPVKAPTPPDVHTRAAEDKLKIQLGTRVRIVRKSRGGRIEIDFTSEDELIRIYDALMGQ
jgi:ParB family transcriptional regulator, chromosome partitioning protein